MNPGTPKKFQIIFSPGQPLSHPPCHAARMKIKKSVRFQVSSFSLFHDAGRRLIAAFGSARLVKKPMAGTNSSAARRTTTPPPANGVRCSRMKWFSPA
jgi:hypothetical protein